MPKFRQYDAILCDGSVRSGKTMAMSIGYLLWSMRSFDHETFAFCGKTIDSLKRNVVTPIQKWMAGVMQPKINLSKNYMDVEWQGHHNRYYFFRRQDESSYALIQGITLAGVLLDEVALMPPFLCGSGNGEMLCHRLEDLDELQPRRQRGTLAVQGMDRQRTRECR